MSKSNCTYVVDMDGNTISVREIGSSRRTTGQVLGIDREEGVETYYVDRLILPPGDLWLNDEWHASGAVSTILRHRSTLPRD